MNVLRIPDAAFAGIADFPFAPHYAEIPAAPGGPALRVHYVDEGPRDAPVVLMMHGEPSWSYLYRHMIGPVAEAGFRVVAPDLIGFGNRTSSRPGRTTATPGMSAGCVSGSRRWTLGASPSSARTGVL